MEYPRFVPLNLSDDEIDLLLLSGEYSKFAPSPGRSNTGVVSLQEFEEKMLVSLDYIGTLFIWDKTPQGFLFWNREFCGKNGFFSIRKERLSKKAHIQLSIWYSVLKAQAQS